MDINQMTYSVQSVIEKAQQLSQSYELQNIEIEAVLLSALNEDESIFKRTLDRAQIDTDELESKYKQKLNQYSVVKGDNIQYGQYISPKLNELFNKANQIKEEMQDDFMSMEHILKASIEVDQTTKD
ncbi:Clp protease N-terminal domain-containing protein, partial [Staphylococcus aureus]